MTEAVREESVEPRIKKHAPYVTDNALTVLEHRYLAKDEQGNVIETPAQMFSRVAENVAKAERRYVRGRPRRRSAREEAIARAFYDLMARLDFLPNSPTLMNAGRDLQQLAACFVLPVGDSLEEIFGAVTHQALIHQSGGGTGFSFSRLRPTHDRVASTSGVASGPVSFMRVFNTATEVIRQGGTRRGANMAILRIDHPDILGFIDVKQDLKELTNFNLSVGMTDAFMRALEKGAEYRLVNPRNKRPVGRIKAKDVFDRIIQAAWATGDPGVVFLDTINRANPTPRLGPIEATNPCAEQPLLPYESCILGSMNLSKFVAGAPESPRVDYDRLGQIIPTAVRFLDNVIDMNHYPLTEIEAMSRGNRKVGLGVMGFADLLIKLGIPYDTEEALRVGAQVMGFIKDRAYAASLALARERGVFPNYRGSRHAAARLRLRNATLTTVAPTGTISIIGDCSPGIEPLYAVSSVRTVMDNRQLHAIHPDFLARAKAAGILSEDLMRRIGTNESIQGIEKIPPELRRLFVTAHDIPPEHQPRGHRGKSSTSRAQTDRSWRQSLTSAV